MIRRYELTATQIFPRQDLGSLTGRHLGRGQPRHEQEEGVHRGDAGEVHVRSVRVRESGEDLEEPGETVLAVHSSGLESPGVLSLDLGRSHTHWLAGAVREGGDVLVGRGGQGESRFLAGTFLRRRRLVPCRQDEGLTEVGGGPLHSDAPPGPGDQGGGILSQCHLHLGRRRFLFAYFNIILLRGLCLYCILFVGEGL